ncbi:hypothetical protein [Enterococcus gilvus]|uniref:hypothetical protein n=1 Tax=Enterococcus gilvus TaxID=160453 RepID=UPI003ED8F721
MRIRNGLKILSIGWLLLPLFPIHALAETTSSQVNTSETTETSSLPSSNPIGSGSPSIPKETETTETTSSSSTMPSDTQSSQEAASTESSTASVSKPVVAHESSSTNSSSPTLPPANSLKENLTTESGDDFWFSKPASGLHMMNVHPVINPMVDVTNKEIQATQFEIYDQSDDMTQMEYYITVNNQKTKLTRSTSYDTTYATKYYAPAGVHLSPGDKVSFSYKNVLDPYEKHRSATYTVVKKDVAYDITPANTYQSDLSFTKQTNGYINWKPLSKYVQLRYNGDTVTGAEDFEFNDLNSNFDHPDVVQYQIKDRNTTEWGSLKNTHDSYNEAGALGAGIYSTAQANPTGWKPLGLAWGYSLSPYGNNGKRLKPGDQIRFVVTQGTTGKQTTFPAQTFVNGQVAGKAPTLTTPAITKQTIPAGKNRTLSGQADAHELIEVQEKKGDTWQKLASVDADATGKWEATGLSLPAQTTLRIVGYDDEYNELMGPTVTTITAQKPTVTSPLSTQSGWVPAKDLTIKGKGQPDDQILLQLYNEEKKTWEDAEQQATSVAVTSAGEWTIAPITLKDGQNWRIKAYRPGGEDEAVYSEAIPVNTKVAIPILTSPKESHQTIPADTNRTFSGTGTVGSQVTVQTYVPTTKSWENIANAVSLVDEAGHWVIPGVSLQDNEKIRLKANMPNRASSVVTDSYTALKPKAVILTSPKHGKNKLSSAEKTTFSGTGQAGDEVTVKVKSPTTSSWTDRAETVVNENGTWSCFGGDLVSGESYQVITKRPDGQSTATSLVYTVIGQPGEIQITNQEIIVNQTANTRVETLPTGMTTFSGTGQAEDHVHLEYKDATHPAWTRFETDTTVDANGKWQIKNVQVINGEQWQAVSDIDTGITKTSHVITGMSPAAVTFTTPKLVDDGLASQKAPIQLKGTGQQNDLVQVWYQSGSKEWVKLAETQVLFDTWQTEPIQLTAGDKLKVVTLRPKGTEKVTTGPYEIVHVIDPKGVTLTAPVVTSNTIPAGGQVVAGTGQPGDVVSLFYDPFIGGPFSEGHTTVDSTGKWKLPDTENMKVGESWHFEITHKYSEQKVSMKLPKILDPAAVNLTVPEVEKGRLLPSDAAYLKGTGQKEDLLHLEVQEKAGNPWKTDTDVGETQVDVSGNWSFQKPVKLVKGETIRLVTKRPGGRNVATTTIPIKGLEPQIPVIQSPSIYHNTVTTNEKISLEGRGQPGDILTLYLFSDTQKTWVSAHEVEVSSEGHWTFNEVDLPFGNKLKITSSREGWPTVSTEEIVNQKPQKPVITSQKVTEGTIRPGNDIWKGTSGSYDHIQLQYQEKGNTDWKNSEQIIADNKGNWQTSQTIPVSGGQNWRVISYRPMNPAIQETSDELFVVNGAPETPKIDTPVVYQNTIPNDDNTIFSGTGHAGDRIYLQYTKSLLDSWHDVVSAKVSANGVFQLPPTDLTAGVDYRLSARVPSYSDATTSKYEATAPAALTSVSPSPDKLPAGSQKWSGYGQKYDFIIWQKYNKQNHTWEDQPGETMVVNGTFSNYFDLTTDGLKEGDIVRLTTHRKGGSKRVTGSIHYVGTVSPQITSPQITNGTIPADDATVLRGFAKPKETLTLYKKLSPGDKIKVQDIQVNEVGEWQAAVGKTVDKEQLEVKDEFGEASVEAMDPKEPQLISPEPTQTTLRPMTKGSLTGTGQKEDELSLQIKNQSSKTWVTASKTSVDAKGHWAFANVTLGINQEIRLVSKRPGGKKSAQSPVFIVTLEDAYLLKTTDLHLTSNSTDNDPAKEKVSILDQDGGIYTGKNQINLTIQSKNEGLLKKEGKTVAPYYLRADGQAINWGKTVLFLDGKTPIKELEGYLIDPPKSRFNGSDMLIFQSDLIYR